MRGAIKLVFSVPEGAAILEIPEPIDIEYLEMLEKAIAIVFRRMKRSATRRDEQAEANAEYASWAPISKGPQQ